MAPRFSHKGLCVGPLTPMKENGDINLDAIPAYAKHLIKTGVNAVFVNGTTGEGVHLAVDERKQIAEKWKQVAGESLKVIVHCGAIAIREAQELAKHAESIGADAIAAIPSFYFPPRSCSELVKCMAEIASAAPNTPFIYYHNPRTHVTYIDMAMFVAMAREKMPTFVGLKWADPNAADANKIATRFSPEECLIMWAGDDTLLCALAMGIQSFNGMSYTLTAPLAEQIISTFEQGDMAKAQELQIAFKEVIDILRNGENIPARLKFVMSLVGLDLGPARIPLIPLVDDDLQTLLKNKKTLLNSAAA